MGGVTADDVRSLRDAAEGLGVDLVTDSQVPRPKLDLLFRTELADLVESGEIKPDDFSALEELCEPLHVSEERAQGMLEELVGKRTGGGVLQAAALNRQEEREAACDEISRTLKYASLLPVSTANAPAVSAKEKGELYALYERYLLSSGGEADATARLEMLKTILGLDE